MGTRAGNHDCIAPANKPRRLLTLPIRPENKNRYPKNWPEISHRIKQRAGNRCEECGLPNYDLGGRDRHGTFHEAIPKGEKLTGMEWPRPGEYWWCKGSSEQLRIIRIILTVAHLDHVPENCSDDNLRAWCQRCHNRYDAEMRRAGIKARARAKNAIGSLL
jgi:5-methylcytosine-specific restriction endonuclease McrA